MDNSNTILLLAAIALLCRVVGVSRMVSTLAFLGVVSALVHHMEGHRSSVSISGSFVSTGMRVAGGVRTQVSASFQHPPDLLQLDPVELIRYYGYPAEYHWVTTADGYILGLHRIPRGRGWHGNSSSSSPRPVVIMAHPLLACSADWVVTGPGKSLAFMLADEGYDVWLLNVRGNTYSRNHTILSPNDERFWDFSFHEHGTLDIPATIEYVLRRTGRKKAQYVGFSMGTTSVWVMGALRPDIASKLTMVTALGPVTDTGHVSSLVAVMAINPWFLSFFRMIGLHEFLPKTALLRWAGGFFCSDGMITQVLCQRFVSSVSGRNDAQFNRTLMPLIFCRTPAGTSLKNIYHFRQSYDAASFQQFDHGEDENIKRYGSPRPPVYDTSRMPFPVRIHYAMNDQLAHWQEAEKMCATFPNVVSCDRVADPLWTHLDFTWGIEAPELVYRKVVDDIKASDAISAPHVGIRRKSSSHELRPIER